VNRGDAISELIALAEQRKALVFVGNGRAARSWAALGDSERVFYMVGSMGLCSAIACGYSRYTARPVLAVEGDGNFLMGLSGLPAVAANARKPFVHVVLDNNCYDTTGGQANLSSGVDFCGLARAAGYKHVLATDRRADLASAVSELMDNGSPGFLHAHVEIGSSTYPRVPMHPRQVRERLRDIKEP